MRVWSRPWQQAGPGSCCGITAGFSGSTDSPGRAGSGRVIMQRRHQQPHTSCGCLPAFWHRPYRCRCCTDPCCPAPGTHPPRRLCSLPASSNLAAHLCCSTNERLPSSMRLTATAGNDDTAGPCPELLGAGATSASTPATTWVTVLARRPAERQGARWEAPTLPLQPATGRAAAATQRVIAMHDIAAYNGRKMGKRRR